MKNTNILNTLTRNSKMKLVVLIALVMTIALQPVSAATSYGSDFTYIISYPQHFGNNPGLVEGTFVGASQSYYFTTYGAETNKKSLLMLQTKHVKFNYNLVYVNGYYVGSLKPHSDQPDWFTEMIEVPAYVLKSSGNNTLTIYARNQVGGTTGDLDDFAVDNAVIFFHQSVN